MAKTGVLEHRSSLTHPAPFSRYSRLRAQVSTFLLALSLTAGLGCLGYELRAKTGGFEDIGHFVFFLLVSLPLCGIPTIAIVIVTGLKSHWPLTFSAGLLALAASLQFALVVAYSDTRWPFYFTPALVMLCSAVGLARNSAPFAPASGMTYAGPILALIGIAAIAGAFAIQAATARHLEQMLQAFRAEDARKNLSLRGLDRAGWLLGKEFSAQEGFSETSFLRTGAYHAPSAGYRWDNSRQCLTATLPVLGDRSGFRPRILPVAPRALAAQALRPGPRPDLAGAVLVCSPPLECSLTWDLDVDSLRPGSRELLADLSDRVTSLEVSVLRELSLQP